MTNRETPVPFDEAHAGDLIGYTPKGKPIHLMGGGAPRDGEIVADDGDDELDDLGGDDSDDDELDEEPPPQRRSNKPSYKDLQDQIKRLEAGQRRNNSELTRRRLIGQWAEKHNITDFDAWLESKGIDKETGQPAGQQPPAEQVTAEQPVPSAAPPAPAAPPVIDETEIDRRVQLRFEQGEAQHAEENDTLREELAKARLESELGRLGFRGKFDTALRVVNLGDIEVQLGDDGVKVVGADVAAKSLQAEIPEWFRRTNGAGPTRTGGEDVDGGTRQRPPQQRDSWEKQIIGRLRGS